MAPLLCRRVAAMHQELQALDHQQYGDVSLSQHIGEALEVVVREGGSDSLESLEQVSKLVWRQRHVHMPGARSFVTPEQLDQASLILELIDKLDSPAAAKVDSVFFDYRTRFAAAGVTFDKDDLLFIRASLIKLAEAEEIAGVRFWGAFQTPRGLLYVAEVDVPLNYRREEDYPQVGPYDVPAELGVGLNRYVYYVTYDIFGTWERLPDVKPSDVVASRDVTYIISGNLSAAVKSFSNFPGNEDTYIRALIARISGACILAPNDLYVEPTVEEEEKQEVPNEEEAVKEPPPKQLKLILNPEFSPIEEIDAIEWVHIRPLVLQQGREVYKLAPKPPKPQKVKADATPKKEKEGGEEEEATEEQHEEPTKEEETEPEAPEVEPEEQPGLFGQQEGDAGFGPEKDVPCWVKHTVPHPSDTKPSQLIESLRWPGAMNLSDGRSSCSLYLGTGKKYVEGGFQPPKPPGIQHEYRRKLIEQTDPSLDREKEVEQARKEKEKEARGEAEEDGD